MKTRLELFKIQNDLYEKYKEKYKIGFTTEKRAYCYIKSKEIFLSLNDWLNPTPRSIFDFLHEIGHLETNTNKMKRCEEEYYATQWAVVEFKNLKLSLCKKDKELFQNYIYMYRNIAIKRKAKNIPTLTHLTLKW